MVISKPELEKAKVLVVEADYQVSQVIQSFLEREGDYKTYSVDNASDAITMTSELYWDTIILDIGIPTEKGEEPHHENGLETLVKIHNACKHTPVITVTGMDENDLNIKCLENGAYYFLNKPLEQKHLSAIVRNAVSYQRKNYDGLSGLISRGLFIDRLEFEHERARRLNEKKSGDHSHQSSLSLIFMDLDDFKQYNDNYSHLAGDYVISAVGRLLRNHRPFSSGQGRGLLRSYDLACRYGGDEFALMLPETNCYGGIIFAKRLMEKSLSIKLKDIYESFGEDNRLKLSMGLATYPFPSDVREGIELIPHADEALYFAKKNNKGSVAFNGPEGPEIVCSPNY